jgi:hypothetical protein
MFTFDRDIDHHDVHIAIVRCCQYGEKDDLLHSVKPVEKNAKHVTYISSVCARTMNVVSVLSASIVDREWY